MITWDTELIQRKDGQLYYKQGSVYTVASTTDICKHYRDMQFNLIRALGSHLTDRPDLIPQELQDVFSKFEYMEQPDNIERIK